MSAAAPTASSARIGLKIAGFFPLQGRLIAERAREVWIAGGIQSGKTRAMAGWLVMQACERGFGAYWWVAQTYQVAERGFREIARMLRPVEARGLARIVPGRLRVELVNGAVIEAKTAADPDNLYGESVRAVVVDEATRCSSVVYDVLRTRLAVTRGPMRFLFNTDKPRRNWALQKFLRARQDSIHVDPMYGRTPDGETAYFHFPTSANPYVTADEIAKAQRAMPDRSFRALYMAEVMEDGAGVFRASDVEAAAILQPARNEAGAILPSVRTREGRYVVGVDLAFKHDFTVAICFDAATSQVVDWVRFTQAETTVQVERVSFLAKKFKAKVLVEENYMGIPIIEMLRKQYKLTVMPFFTGAQSKAELIADLMLRFEQRKIFIPTKEWFPEMTEELLNYGYEYNPKTNAVRFSAPEGLHDDIVMALALALHGSKAAGGPFSFLAAKEGPSRAEEWRKAY